MYILFSFFPCSYILCWFVLLIFVNIVTQFYKFYLITNILLTIFADFLNHHLFQWILYPKKPEQMLFQYTMWILKRSLMSLRISSPQTQAPNSRGNRCSALKPLNSRHSSYTINSQPQLGGLSNHHL